MQVYNDELYHYGKKGMKWGHRKQKKEEQADKDFKRRNKVINRIKKQKGVNEFGQSPEGELGWLYVTRGEKATNRILDIMDKNPKKSLSSASNQQQNEEFAKNFAKKFLITSGALALGAGLSKFHRTYG